MQHHDSVIAIILADRLQRIKDFMKVHSLPQTGFLKVTDREHLQGLDPKIPVIYTYGEGPEFNNAVDYAKMRFRSVRYIDF